ncbi:MAG: iron ABC transporter permease [Synergistota bacterium]|nr:iron ABC transporter permease [Synergistota bacterium]
MSCKGSSECRNVRGKGGGHSAPFFALLFAAALAVSLVVAISVGDVPLGAGEISRALVLGVLGKGSGLAHAIVWQVRLPRSLAAVAAGATLAESGVVFQGLLLNPLAEPYTLGVASGAAFGASLSIVLGLPFVTPLAFAGSLLCLVLVWFIGRRGDSVEPTRLILAGVVVGSILGAAVTLLKALAGQQVATVVLWLLGSFSNATWSEVPWLFVSSSVVLLLGLFYSRALDLVALGGGRAAAQGVDVRRMRALLLLVSSCATAVVVSFCGVIGFVGLLVPHMARLLFGPAHGRLLCVSWLIGGIVMLYADVASRLLGELPVGVITAVAGGPLFCALLWRKRDLARG